MEKIKIGFAGLGDHALQFHLKPLLKIECVEFAGAFEPDIQAFERVEKNYGSSLKPFARFEDMLCASDAVIICSPDKYHIQQLRIAVESGKHILCEKPLAATEHEVVLLKACLDLAEQKQLVITGCHPRRFDPPYTELKYALPELQDKFGKVIGIDFDFSHYRLPKDTADLPDNNLLQKHIGDEIDCVNFLFGQDSFKVYKLIDEFDRYEVTGIRDDGLTFRFRGTCRLNFRTSTEMIELRFEKGTVSVNTYQNGLNAVYNHEYPVKIPRYFSVSNDGKSFEAINRNFIDAIRGKAKNYLTANELLITTMTSTALRYENKFRF